MAVFALILVICGGIATGIQTPTNVSVGNMVGPLGSGLVNFTGGFLTITLAVLLFGSGDLSAALDAPWWQIIGGAYGVVIVLAGIVASPVLGVALFTTLLMVGQLGMGMVVDAFGLFGAAVHPPTIGRVLGFLVVLVGILFIYRGKRAGSDASSSSAKRATSGQTAFAILFSLIGGASVSCQVPTNASLAVSTGTLEGAMVSFAGGLLIMLVVCLVAQRGKLRYPHGAKPWQLVGGVYGAFLVVCNMVASIYLGVGLAVAAALLGTVSIALVIDTRGWLHATKIPLNGWRLGGVLLVACGILIACVFSAVL